MTTIKLRRGTAAEWTTANPILAAGEMGIETDTRKFKFGDGVAAWNTLAYASAEGGGGTIDDSTITTTSVWSSSKTNAEITTAVDTINSTKNDNIFDIGKFTVVGSPTITDDGVASGFSNTSYLQTIKLDTSKPFKIITQFIWKKPSNNLNFSCILAIASTYIDYGREGSGCRMWLNLSTSSIVNNNQWFAPLIEGNKYFSVFSWDGSTYTHKTLDINGILIATNTYSSSEPIVSNYLILGYTYNPWAGSIDLKQFSITVDGEQVFNGLMESTKHIYDKITTTNTALSTFQTDTDNNFSAVNSALNEKANLSDLALKQNTLSDGNGTKVANNKVDINQGIAGIQGLTFYQNNGTITKNNDLSITFNNGACGYIYFQNKGVNNNYEIVLHCAYNRTHGSRQDSDIHGIRVEPDTNFPNSATDQGCIWVDIWSSPFRVVIINTNNTQDYGANIPTVNYIKYTIIGTKIRQYYSTNGVDYTLTTYNNNKDYVEISETTPYINLCIANRNDHNDIRNCWTNTTLYSDSYVLDKTTNTYLMKLGIANEGVAVATSNKYGLVLPDNSTIVSSNGVISAVGGVQSSAIHNMIAITQAEYDALQTKDATTLYLILEGTT